MENEIRFTFYMQFSFDFLSIEIFKFFRSLRILDWLQKLQNLNSSLDGLDILKSRFFLRHTWHEITVCDQLFFFFHCKFKPGAEEEVLSCGVLQPDDISAADAGQLVPAFMGRTMRECNNRLKD